MTGQLAGIARTQNRSMAKNACKIAVNIVEPKSGYCNFISIDYPYAQEPAKVSIARFYNGAHLYWEFCFIIS